MANVKDAEQRVAEQEVERFQAALGPFVVAAETTRMPMLFTNAEVAGDPIIFANDSMVALLGYEREELLAREFNFCFAERAESGGRQRIEHALKEDTPTPVEMECRRKDGQVFPAAVYISPVFDEEGKVVQHFSSFVDLTAYHEHKLALARILSLQTELIHVGRVSAMGTMATTLAHELNQPLTAIANYAAGAALVLASGETNLSPISLSLTAIEESAIRAGAIISRLRDMTRGGPPRREVFDLNDAVRESVEIVRAGACEGVLIVADIEDVVMIEADRVQIQQVVINLVRNGCEAAAGAPDARVVLSTRVEGEQAIVSVDDTGPGIPAERSADLFEWSESEKPDGMGVGLSISRTIVEAHQGRIWLARRDMDRTRFRFAVPLGNSEDGGQAGIGLARGRGQ